MFELWDPRDPKMGTIETLGIPREGLQRGNNRDPRDSKRGTKHNSNIVLS